MPYDYRTFHILIAQSKPWTMKPRGAKMREGKKDFERRDSQLYKIAGGTGGTMKRCARSKIALKQTRTHFSVGRRSLHEVGQHQGMSQDDARRTTVSP